jgi:hypothetical protein
MDEAGVHAPDVVDACFEFGLGGRVVDSDQQGFLPHPELPSNSYSIDEDGDTLLIASFFHREGNGNFKFDNLGIWGLLLLAKQ